MGNSLSGVSSLEVRISRRFESGKMGDLHDTLRGDELDGPLDLIFVVSRLSLGGHCCCGCFFFKCGVCGWWFEVGCC